MNLKMKQCLYAGGVFSLITQVILWVILFRLNKKVEEMGPGLLATYPFPPDLFTLVLTLVLGFVIGFILACLFILIFDMFKKR